MKGVVCQLHYHGGGCLRSVHGQSSGYCDAAWQFATAPQGLKVGDAVTFTLTGGGQAVDLRVEVRDAKTEKGPAEASAETSPRTGGGEAADLEIRPDESTMPLKRGPEPAVQRKLQRNMTRFHNANPEQQLDMLLTAEQRLNAVLAADEVDGAALCSLVNQLAGFLHAPGDTFEVSSSTGDASVAAGCKTAGLQQKVRKLLIDCLELLDLGDIPTYDLVETALQHIAQLVMLRKMKQNQPDEDPSSRSSRKRSLAVTQWQTLAALVGTNQDDSLPVARADAAKRKGTKRKDRASSVGGEYQPNSKVRKLPSVFRLEEAVTVACSRCGTTMTSPWFWRHPRHETDHVLVPHKGHESCHSKFGKACPWLPLDGRAYVGDRFSSMDFCHHKCRRTQCVACGGADICQHKKRVFFCKLCKAERAAAQVAVRKGKMLDQLHGLCHMAF
eukprot:Skav215309  [mRNA]  locus=scaffold2444:43307:44635:+ [translate_table: standard]